MTTHQRSSDARALPGTMRAAVRQRYGTPDEVLRVASVPLPQISGGEVLVQVHAAGLDRGVWHVLTGLPYLVRMAGYGVRAPKNPVVGRDLAGVIAQVGGDVTGLNVGDEVYGTGDGTFAEYAGARADQVSLKPGTLSFEQAAAVPVSAQTALQAVREHGRVQPGQEVLVVGASGGVGSYAVQIAKAHGAHVTGVAGPAKLDLVRALGADAVLDHTTDALPARRYDVILDVGGSTPVSRLRRALTRRGTLVMVGGESSGRVLGGVQRQLGAILLSPFVRQRLITFVCKENADDLAVLRDLVDGGQVTPAVDRVLPLDRAVDALLLLIDGSVRGKVVLTP